MELNYFFKQVFNHVGITQAEAGKILGRTPKLFNDRLVRETLRYTEFLDILDALNIDVTYICRSNGEEVKPVKEQTLETLVDYVGSSMDKVGKFIGKPPKKFSDRRATGLFRATEFLTIVDKLGFTVRYSDRNTGEILTFFARAIGRPVNAMINGVKYYTNKCRAVASSFYADGTHMYTGGSASELYLTDDGKYLMAVYSEYEGIKDRLYMMTEESAKAFIQQYGLLEI